MTAFTHGLPQLIQDDDVDVDYPVDCSLDVIDIEQLSFPLPGETTQVNSFIALVHLSLILASILEQLYTTTKRRHGGEKIGKLHNRLQAWNERFRPLEPDIHFDGYNDTAQVWLAFLYHFAMLMIHRPGLTFDDETSQFRECLEHCQSACSEILRISFSPAGRGSILGIAPLGPSILFQSGLMDIHYHCYTAIGVTQGSHRDQRPKTIEIVQNLLSDYRSACRTGDGPRADCQGDIWNTAMLEASQVLQSLNSAMSTRLGPISHLAGEAGEQSLLGRPTPALSLGPAGGDSALLTDLGSLGDLNQLDYLDWILDGPFDAMTGLEQDFGV